MYPVLLQMKFLNNLFKRQSVKRTERFCVTLSPKEDITPYELAQCVKFYAFALAHPHFPSKTYEFIFKGYPDNVKRHFKTELKQN